MRLTRPVLAAAAAGAALALSLPASAGASYSWTDKKGDGNAINSQGNGVAALDAGTPTATSEPGRDILKVSYGNLMKKVGKKTVCDGFTATMTLSGKPVGSTIYRIFATTAENTARYTLSYDSFEGRTFLRHGTGPTDDTEMGLKFPAKLSGNTITWRVPMSDVKATNEKAGSVLKGFAATAAGSQAGVLYLPVYDRAQTAKPATFTIC